MDAKAGAHRDSRSQPLARMHDDELTLDEVLVRRLLASQLPGLADRALRAVEPWGTDNAIWRLGDDLVVRLPRRSDACEQVEHEATWLPHLAPRVPVAIPEPVAVGEPDLGYPCRWAVHRWIPGQGAGLATMDDPARFARDLAATIRRLHAAPTDGGPPATNRARPLQDYDEDARTWIARASHLIDAEAATAVWDEALAAPAYDGPGSWVHGDLEGNCLTLNGRLCGIVDWGSSCVGDPAVDLQVIWSPLFTDETRDVFLDELAPDRSTVARSRGAAVQQACAALPYYLHTYPLIVERSWHKLAALGVAALRRTSGPR